MKRLLLLLLLLTACPKRVPFPELATLSDADVQARLTKSASLRSDFSGVIKAALPGVQGVVANVTVDVAARKPGDLFVAVRSFFEVPAQVLTARTVDGVGEVTLYDASSGVPVFFKGPANDRTLQRVLGVPLAPDDAVALVLGRPPLDQRPNWPPPRVRLAGVDEEQGTFTAVIERPGRGAVSVVVDGKDDSLISASFFRGDGRLAVSAQFEGAQEGEGAGAVTKGVKFPKRLRLKVHDAPKAPEVVLSVEEGKWNEGVVDDSFVLSVPDGVEIKPL